MERVTVLAGGVGGAKLAHGFALCQPEIHLTVIVNTGDDFDHFGLRICPDLDTVCYTLAGLANPQTGWGRRGETFEVLHQVGELGGPTWFRLGDKDLATHLERTRRLREGQRLSQVVEAFCSVWGITAQVLPMSDDPVRTMVHTLEYGWLGFQDYFVRHACLPTVKEFSFEGIEKALPAPGVLEALETSDLIVIAPSNPWVSIQPILSLKGVASLIQTKKVVAVSPIIQGQAIKGPAARMYREMGIEPSALAVARHYQPYLWGFVLDELDRGLETTLSSSGIMVLTTQTIMHNEQDRLLLAKNILSFSKARTLEQQRREF